MLDAEAGPLATRLIAKGSHQAVILSFHYDAEVLKGRNANATPHNILGEERPRSQ